MPPDFRLRASPFVELKKLAELDCAQRAPFFELERDPDFYGLFVPKPPLTMNIQSVSRQTAELFLSPRATLDADGIDLVLDGFLEIESSDGFVSGADAFPLLCSPASRAIRDANARLSRDALLHAQDLETNDAQELTTALYLYNRIPLTPFWKARFPNRDAVRAHLAANRQLERDWTEVSAEKPDGWLTWASKEHGDGARGDGYKLYVNPRPERMRDAFAIVVRALSGMPDIIFKVGDSAANLLRPDKLVVYCTTREQMREAASALRRELAGCEAHGVPFTASLDEDGLLSWGIDPNAESRPLSWMTIDSWRFRIVRLLGPAIAIAKLARTAAAIEPWRFATERVRRAGIDVETWSMS